MLIDSVVIKLKRIGFGNNPSYNIFIYGDGKVVFEGIKNVETVGIVKDRISKEKVINLLEELKKSNFFKIDKDFEVNPSSNQPSVDLTLEFKDENGALKKKTISHHVYDPRVPSDLKNFENKIDEIVDTKKWINAKINEKDMQKSEISDRSNDKSKFIKKNKKSIILISCILVAVILVSSLFISGAFNFDKINISDTNNNFNTGGNTNSDDENNKDSSEENYNENILEGPQFTYINTTNQSNRTDNKRSPKVDLFTQGDTVYVDYEFTNVKHNNSLNITIDINISLDGREYNHTSISIINDSINNEEFYLINGFDTDKNWPANSGKDPYLLNITITDNLLNESNFKIVTFYLSNFNKPSVEISGSPLSGYAFLTVSFDCTCENFTGNIISYNWDFGDGSEYSGVKPTHTYYNPGTFVAKVTVTDDNGNTANDSITINVLEMAESSFKVGISHIPEENTGYSPYQLEFAGEIMKSGTPPYTFQWDFNCSGKNNFKIDKEGKNVSKIFTTNDYMDSFWVYLKVADSNGNIAWAETFIFVMGA